MILEREITRQGITYKYLVELNPDPSGVSDYLKTLGNKYPDDFYFIHKEGLEYDRAEFKNDNDCQIMLALKDISLAIKMNDLYGKDSLIG